MEIKRQLQQLMAALALSLVLCSAAYAQTDSGAPVGAGAAKQECMKMDEGMMPMMDKMMKGMMMKDMMMKDMMQMMLGMMDMQERAMMKVRPAEKRQMMMDMARMKEKMKGMMSMMGQSSDGPMKMKCAEEWLKKAIDLHEVHLKDPRTATEESQVEMMDQMMKAYECITAPPMDMDKAKDKKPSADPHKH